ncbi:MAG: FAD-dependent pyridine nucleotide-disulfide oxidoreductase [Gemmatimonadetes bacterium]|nr:FAD-dependent pyridine nucleotide-disulfide oxidoreductase [Gemmatimonadota bacterium]
MSTPTSARVAIIGSGFGGLGAAIRLKQAGIHDFVILERAAALGGTWRDNQYPGCACDVQSHLYSYSFALNPDWSNSYSTQPEIWQYLERCADAYDVRKHIRFGANLERAEWSEASRRWELSTSAGGFSAEVLLLASGSLSDPWTAALPGIEQFEGAAFHSARWRHDIDLRDKRVVVIGTGASAIQFVPAIQPAVGQLTVFQRTAPWVLPRHASAIGARARRLYRTVPGLQRALRGAIYAAREMMVVAFRHPAAMALAERAARHHLAGSVSDPVLREKLTPNFRLGCKRVLLSDDYLAALAQPNVSVVTSAAREVRAHSVVDAAGVEHPADVIIYGTGFRATDPPIAPRVHGRGGVTLAEAWQGSPRAHLGITVNGFPNLFMLMGPNTGLGHTSVVYMIESQLEHFMGAMEFMGGSTRGSAAHVVIEPRPEVQAAYVAEVDRRMRGTVWTSGGCRSWYLDVTGRNSALWPDFTWRYRRRVARFNEREYVTT